MIKLCLDENISPHMAGPLKRVFKRVSFTSVYAEGVTGYQDVELFEALASKDINGLITLDQKQLENQIERDGLRAANLHWIGLPMPEARGYAQQALIATSLISGIRAIIDRNFADTPHMFLLPGTADPSPGLVAVHEL